MYIEIRKNAFYVKESKWNKETKKTESKSVYLGSDFTTAKTTLEAMVTPDSPILEDLSKAQEKYAYDRAISVLGKLIPELGESKAAKDVQRLFEKFNQAQQKSAEKELKKLPPKSQFRTDAESQQRIEEQTDLFSDNQAQNNSDDNSQENTDNKSDNVE